MVAEGTNGTFTVALSGTPDVPVVVSIQLSGSGLVLGSATSLTFTPENWNVPQAVLFGSISDDDGVDDIGSVTISADGWAMLNIPITVFDDDRRVLLDGPTAIHLVLEQSIWHLQTPWVYPWLELLRWYSLVRTGTYLSFSYSQPNPMQMR
jgi:hypothetical protein